jgi:hypothetical protein
MHPPQYVEVPRENGSWIDRPASGLVPIPRAIKFAPIGCQARTRLLFEASARLAWKPIGRAYSTPVVELAGKRWPRNVCRRPLVAAFIHTIPGTCQIHSNATLTRTPQVISCGPRARSFYIRKFNSPFRVSLDSVILRVE